MDITHIDLIAAARPNFMKVAPAYHALARQPWCQVRLVHTGQHYDPNMSDTFFNDLGLPTPDVHLNIGSGSHAEQTGGVMIAYERICQSQRPNWIIVVGDVNSTAACALVGAKLWIPVAHLEAGLRSRDRRMPEEVNRLVTDALADVLWTPSPDADENLRAEGVPAEKIDRIGNIMIDSYELMRPKIEAAGTRARLGLTAQGYGVVTLHRPSNVDDPVTLGALVQALINVAGDLPLVFPVHPRSKKQLQGFDLYEPLATAPNITLTDPLSYVEFMNLVHQARLAITDSGGIQEETTYLGVPCLTLRDTTERPITVTHGSNKLVGVETLADAVQAVLNAARPQRRCPPLWDGQTAARLVTSLHTRLNGRAV